MDGMNTSWPLSLVWFCIVLDPGAQILQLLESAKTLSAELFCVLEICTSKKKTCFVIISVEEL